MGSGEGRGGAGQGEIPVLTPKVQVSKGGHSGHERLQMRQCGLWESLVHSRN